jgi:hypothetical protein
MSIKNEKIDFSDMSGGKNSRSPRHALLPNQVVDTVNALHEDVGCSLAPGYTALVSSFAFDPHFVNEVFTRVTARPYFTHPIRGHFVYKHDNGTETQIVISNKTIYTVSTATRDYTVFDTLNGGMGVTQQNDVDVIVTAAEWGVATIGTLTGDGECYAINAGGKLWIVNGTDFVKIEDDLSVYRVQIVAPSGSTVSPVFTFGATLQYGGVGIFGCYVCYARKNNDGQYLYSLPESLGNVTLDTTQAPWYNSIMFSVPRPTDPQVTHIVIFLTDANGAEVFRYWETTTVTMSYIGYTSDTIMVINNSQRNGDIKMLTVSANNQILPIIPSGIYSYNNKIYVWEINGKALYWSVSLTANPFDLERFMPENFLNSVYSINSLFSINTNLYLNHIGNGITTIINGDLSSIPKHTNSDFWFLDCKTQEGKSNVVFFRNSAFGLTNDGFRFYYFGNFSTNYLDNFSEDLSLSIKPDVAKIYAGIGSTNNLPCAIVFRRGSKRTEYRFSYRNLDYGSLGNNDQRIFNLDFYFDPNNQRKTWECWENGFASMITMGGEWYGAQSIFSGGQLVRETGVTDIYCYDRTGTFQPNIVIKQFYIMSRTIMDNLESITVWGAPYMLATNTGIITGNVIVFDNNNSKYSFSKAAIPQTANVLPLILPFIMQPIFPIGSSDPISYEARGNSLAIELSYTTDDPDFYLYKVTFPKAKQITSNIT